MNHMRWHTMVVVLLGLTLTAHGHGPLDPPVASMEIAASTAGIGLHVVPDGSDENPGTETAPVATLEKAKLLAREARKMHPNKTITIWLHPGIHSVTTTVEFNAVDSGTAAAPLQIFAWQDPQDPSARPLLVGGSTITGWKPSDFNGRNDVWEADLKQANITKKFHQIYLDGKRQIWARYPNFDTDLPYSGGWAYVAGERPPMYTDIDGERTDTVVLREKDARVWDRPSDGEVCIFPRYNWWNRIEKMKEFNSETRTITLERQMQYAARPEDRFAIFGMREELDAPGEWYQDVDSQTLYFLPPEGTDLKQNTVSVPTVDHLLQFTNAQHVVIRGLELTCAEESAVKMSHCENVVLEKSLVHDLGYFNGAGISISGGRDCVVRGCDIWNIGGHGVSAYGGDNVQMDCCNHVIENCYIHHVGQFNRHGIGIMIGGVGVLASHNLIHDMPRCGVFHGGVLNTLQYNRIRHCNLEMEDTGCTYTGGWTGGWHTIRYNHCTDSIGFNNHGKFFVFAWGIYLDESGCGNDVYGNIVERCQVGAMHLHNARENHIYNNIFAHNAGPQGKTHQLSLQTWNDSPQGVFLRDRQPKMLESYLKLMQNPEWAKMRGMHVSPADPFLPDGTIMRGNRIERNIFYYPEQPDSIYVQENGINLQHNIIDNNLVWNGGEAPIRTGKHVVKKVVAELPQRIPNGDFSRVCSAQEMDTDGNKTVLAGWDWYHKTFPNLEAEIVTTLNGKKALKLPGAFNEEQRYIKNTCIRSAPFVLEPGKNYRMTFQLRHQDATGDLSVRFVAENQGLWKAFGANGFLNRSDTSGVYTMLEPFECQTSFRLPSPSEADYDQRAEKLTLQFQFNSKQGWAEISDLRLEEVEQGTEWEAWQSLGADEHSIVADPLFMDTADCEFHLSADSPAWKLGFEPIPLEQIGPYEDPARATWPIQEAEGVREHPEWLQSVPIE